MTPDQKLIILDRDGVINFDSPEYIKSPQEWLPIPGSLEAIVLLNKAGYTVVVATNQSGIARQLYSVETLDLIHEKMSTELHTLGGKIDAIFYCPHGPQEGCYCRKPKPGLLHQIAHVYHRSLTCVPLVGDSMRDIEAALAAGAAPVLVLSGNGLTTQQKYAQQLKQNLIPVYPDLLSFAMAISI